MTREGGGAPGGAVHLSYICHSFPGQYNLGEIGPFKGAILLLRWFIYCDTDILKILEMINSPKWMDKRLKDSEIKSKQSREKKNFLPI